MENWNLVGGIDDHGPRKSCGGGPEERASHRSIEPAGDQAGLASPAAEAVHRAAVRAIDGIEADLPRIARIADEAARGYVESNIGIRAAGDPVFVMELVGRCGGAGGRIRHPDPARQRRGPAPGVSDDLRGSAGETAGACGAQEVGYALACRLERTIDDVPFIRSLV